MTRVEMRVGVVSGLGFSDEVANLLTVACMPRVDTVHVCSLMTT